jgi:hypothetical protein
MQTVEVEAKNQLSTIKKQKNGGKDKGRKLAAAICRGQQHDGNGCCGGQGNGGGQWL